MYWKLVDDVSGEIIVRSTIYLKIELGIANLQVDPIEAIKENFEATPDDNLHTEIFSLINDDPIKALPTHKSWFGGERVHEHHEDNQQRHFHLEQSKVINVNIGI